MRAPFFCVETESVTNNIRQVNLDFILNISYKRQSDLQSNSVIALMSTDGINQPGWMVNEIAHVQSTAGQSPTTLQCGQIVCSCKSVVKMVN